MSFFGEETMTKQGYSKKRKNLNPEVFRVLNDEYVKMMYEGRNDIKVFGEYYVLAVDGSIIELPNNKGLKEECGVIPGQEGSVGRVRGRAMGVYDCLNSIMVHTRIGGYNGKENSEKTMIREEIPKIQELMKEKPFILVMDRGYCGLAFLNYLEKNNVKYLVRVNNKHYKEEKASMKTTDEVIKIKLRSNSLMDVRDESEKEELKKQKYYETRIIKVMIGETEEHLMTNLSREELEYEDVRELYHIRWEIEKSFDVLKNKIELENFSAQTMLGIEQEFYAGIVLYNIVEDVYQEAKSDATREGRKYETKINKNILVGILKEDLIKLVMKRNKVSQLYYYNKIVKEIKKYLADVRPGRKHPRYKTSSRNKYRSNMRRNS